MPDLEPRPASLLGFAPDLIVIDDEVLHLRTPPFHVQCRSERVYDASMARLDRTFVMEESPTDAQARFRKEIGQALDTMGFKLVTDVPAHLAFQVRYMGGVLFIGLITLMVWLWRKARGYNVEVDFTQNESGTRVEIYGKTPGDVAALINVLGRQGHWPSNPQDPAWVAEGVPESPSDELSSWDDTDIDPSQLDRVTRRALRKAGKLPR